MSDERVDAQLTSSLIGLLAVVEGLVRVDRLPLDVVLRLRQRLVRSRVLPARGPGGDDVVDALDALVQHLRRYEQSEWQDLNSDDLLLVNVVAFPEPEGAEAFAGRMRDQGKDVDPVVHEPEYQRWTVVIHHSDRASAAPGVEFAAAVALGGRHLGAF